jgi:hypothetical protein
VSEPQARSVVRGARLSARVPRGAVWTEERVERGTSVRVTREGRGMGAASAVRGTQ